jgi:dihydroorotase
MLTRREFSKSLLAGGTALLASPNLQSAGAPPPSPDADSNPDCDLLIKGGTVIDPSQRLHAPLDVAVKDGRIFEVSQDFPEARARKVIGAKGRFVTPGLIDLHVHCDDGMEDGINADHYCLGRGVTAAVDAGSVGHSLITGFVRNVIRQAATRIYALVDVGVLGLVAGVTNVMQNLDWVNPGLTAKAAIENKPAVVGIKVRLTRVIQGDKDLECLRRAVQAAEASHLPLMVHIDDPYSPLPDILRMLRKGDVFTHYLNGHPHGVLDANGKILPEVLEARERGIFFDPAQGRTHFSFETAEKCLAQGLLPDTISTDLTQGTVSEMVYDLPAMASKFMALGMTLDQVVERVTARPAAVYDYGLELGTLRPGSEANIGVFELREGSFEFLDGHGEKRVGRQRLVNKTAVCRGQLWVNQT